jgi:hypothetical protein
VVMSSGRYHWGGWTVDHLSGEGAGRMASIHEAWHDRLQFTTMYGLLVQHLWSVGDATGGPRWTSRGDDLLLGAQRTHEEFASVMTEQTSADLAGALRASYPVYARHADRARQRVGAADGYTFLHRVNALYRACMQPADAAYLRGLAAVTAATVSRQARPDHRLAVLTAALKHHGWGNTTENPGSSRTVLEYANDDDVTWEQASRATYEWCARLLGERECPTLPYEGQLDHVEKINRLAVAAAGGPIRLVPASASTDDREGDTDVVMRAFESETVTFGTPVPWCPAPAGTGPSDMISGHGGDAHLFVCLRPVARVPPMAGALAGDMPQADMVMIRSTIRDQEGALACVALDVTQAGPGSLLVAGVPVIASVSMRSLASSDLKATWAPLLRPEASTVMVDLSLARHLRLWLSDRTVRARYGLGRYSARGRKAVAIGLRIESSAGSSRLHLAVVSPSYAAAFEVWLAETPAVSGHVIRDDSLFDENEPLVTVTMGHLLAEEPRFDFKAGELQ